METLLKAMVGDLGAQIKSVPDRLQIDWKKNAGVKHNLTGTWFL